MIKLIKILSIIIIIFSTKSSFAEIGTESWNKNCSNENEENCFVAITKEVKLKDNKRQTIATAFIRIVSSKQKEMNLIDEKDQTYKLSEKNKDVGKPSAPTYRPSILTETLWDPMGPPETP